MSIRSVTSIGVDRQGEVVRLCHDGADWSPIAVADAVMDMELGIHSYCVNWPEGTTQITDAMDGDLKYLRTERDGTARNSLLDLPRR
jgi:hypothetical protein